MTAIIDRDVITAAQEAGAEEQALVRHGSAAADRRSGAPCSPVESVSGGSQRANVAPGRGEPSSVTATTGSPTSREAAPAGSASTPCPRWSGVRRPGTA